MDELPKELITHSICIFLVDIDQQVLRRCSKQLVRIIPYKPIEWNNTSIELVHLIKYRRLWNVQTTAWIAKNGWIECLKYARLGACDWDSDTTALAARNGYLECLVYACQNGCLWAFNTTALAAKSGHIDCLKYAHNHGCV